MDDTAMLDLLQAYAPKGAGFYVNDWGNLQRSDPKAMQDGMVDVRKYRPTIREAIKDFADRIGPCKCDPPGFAPCPDCGAGV